MQSSLRRIIRWMLRGIGRVSHFRLSLSTQFFTFRDCKHRDTTTVSKVNIHLNTSPVTIARRGATAIERLSTSRFAKFITVCFYFINFYSCTRYKLLCSYNLQLILFRCFSNFFGNKTSGQSSHIYLTRGG